MVMLLPAVEGARFTDKELQQAANIRQNIAAILSPLTQVRKTESLNELLNIAARPYLQQLVRALYLHESPQAQAEAFTQAVRELETQARSKAPIFGEDALDQFLGALESMQGFVECALRAMEKGGAEAQSYNLLNSLVGEHAVKASMCIVAVQLVLLDSVKDWHSASIPLLAAVADDAMTAIEDGFLEVLGDRGGWASLTRSA
jgi:hypothetical protein